MMEMPSNLQSFHYPKDTGIPLTLVYSVLVRAALGGLVLFVVQNPGTSSMRRLVLICY